MKEGNLKYHLSEWHPTDDMDLASTIIEIMAKNL